MACRCPGPWCRSTGADATATTDTSGRYTLQVRRRDVRGDRIELRVEAPGLANVTTQVVVAGPAVTADVALSPAFSEMVTVGSRAAGSAAERAVPVDVITREQIAGSGFTETAQVIQSLAPSFNFPRPTITDGTDTVRPATLRGLGPDQVLVLINGKRRHQSALVHLNGSIGRGSTGVDLNAIPVAAIDHIEVLRDGAAAQYGSDAIAGVINIVLKSGVARPAITSSFGLSKGSFAGNRCNAAGLACAAGDDIDFADGGLADVGGSWGVGLGTGSLTIAAEYRHHNRTNRASFDPRDQIVPGDAGNNAVAEPNHRWGDPDTRDLMTFVNFNAPLNKAESRFVYGFGGFSRRAANSAGFFRRALDVRNWPQIYPLGFLPEIQPEVLDGSATGGIRGVARGWNYDASGEYGRNRFDFTIGNTLNTSLGPTVPPNQTTFDAGGLLLQQVVGNVDVSRAFAVRGVPRRVNVAFGTEYRRENYQIRAGEPNSYGDGGVPNQIGERAAIGAQVFPGFRPSNEVDRSRDSIAAYIDVEHDVTRWLRLGGAGRTEHYSDFGNTVNGKFTARLEPDPRLVVRTAVSTGFRAPSLGQSFFSSTATNFLNLGQGLVPVESLTLPVDSRRGEGARGRAARTRAVAECQRGRGADAAPGAERDRRLLPYRDRRPHRALRQLHRPPIAVLLAPFGANSARFFTNAIDTRTNGVDVAANYRIALDTAGTLFLRAGYNNTRTRVVGAVATPPELAGFESVLFDRIEQRRIECGQPKDSVRLGGDWRRNRLGASLLAARYGEYCSFTLRPADDQVYGAKWLTDVDVSFRAGGYTIGGVVQNLFDVFPDRNTTVNSFNGIQTFPSQSPFGMNGRAFILRVGRTF